MSIIQQVVKRSGDTVPFSPQRITNAIYRAAVAVGGRDQVTAEKLSQQVIEILEQKFPEGTIPTVEDVQDAVEKVLIENAHAKVAKEFILYREERTRRRRERAGQASRPSANIPWAKIWHSLDWAIDHGVNSIKGLNARIEAGEYTDLIAETEAAYTEEVENAVELISECCEKLRLVIITGPSSSGKTTTTIKVGQRLERMGMNLITLNIDNYFFDLEVHPKDEFGDYDFETPQALDISLINEHLIQLVEGQEVLIPFYDFKTGKRYDRHTSMRVLPDDIILIDSLHGLYPPMTEGIPDDQKFKLYLEPLLQMKTNDLQFVRWTDLRLIRRMLRDAVHRAYDPRQTLEHWHYVRSSEMRYIIPNISSTDYIINTSLPYELPIYRARMLDHFNRWVDEYRENPLRQDAFIRANRVMKLLRQITPVEDDSPIPGDSILREFIGGSVYEY
jgi:uridine kinase